jgi:16S rRNA G1207 methylase RsmC
MSQLTFPWNDVNGTSSSGASITTAQTVVDVAPRIVPGDTRSAERCRMAAAAIEKHITAKHDSASRTLALPPTRKRIQEADAQRRQAIRLERVQRTLEVLAQMHELGTITPELAPLTSKAAVESALFNQPSESAIHAIFKAADRAETNAEQALRLTQEALVLGIPGYFPTPPDVAEGLLPFASFDNMEAVLEPSAGTGALIDAVLTHHPEARVSYCEINVFLLDVLRLKYWDSKSVRFLERDSGELGIRHDNLRFNAIIMNPPFEKGQDIDHVLRAHRRLAPNGILAAIISEGAFHRVDKKASAFRLFLASTNAVDAKLLSASFKPSGTAVACRMIRIRAGC